MKDLSLYMLDLAQNSVRAGARHLVIEVDSQPQQGSSFTVYLPLNQKGA